MTNNLDCVYIRFMKVIDKAKDTQRVVKVCGFNNKPCDFNEEKGICKYERKVFDFSRKEKRK